MPITIGPDSFHARDTEEEKHHTPKVSVETTQKRADLRIKATQETEKKERAESDQKLTEISRKIDGQEHSVEIGNAALEVLKKTGIADQLMAIMQRTFRNPDIQVQSCVFAAETRLGNGRLHRAIGVRVIGSETRLTFGFDQVGNGWELGELQLNPSEGKFVQSLFP